MLSLIIPRPQHHHFCVWVSRALLNRSAQTRESPPRSVPVTGKHNNDVRIRLLFPMCSYISAWYQLVKSVYFVITIGFFKRMVGRKKYCKEKFVHHGITLVQHKHNCSVLYDYFQVTSRNKITSNHVKRRRFWEAEEIQGRQGICEGWWEVWEE